MYFIYLNFRPLSFRPPLRRQLWQPFMTEMPLFLDFQEKKALCQLFLYEILYRLLKIFYHSLWKLHLNSDREDIHRLYKYCHQTTGNWILNSSNATCLVVRNKPTNENNRIKMSNTPYEEENKDFFTGWGGFLHISYIKPIYSCLTLLKTNWSEKNHVIIFLMIFPYLAETVQLFSRMTRMTHAIPI